jgi:hypothetical protein
MVNIQKTRENHHLLGKSTRIYAIFNSKLLEKTRGNQLEQLEPGIHVLARTPAGWNTPTGLRLTENIFTLGNISSCFILN